MKKKNIEWVVTKTDTEGVTTKNYFLGSLRDTVRYKQTLRGMGYIAIKIGYQII